MVSPPDHRYHSRKRSRSPDRDEIHDHVRHTRSRSPHRRQHHRHHHHHHHHHHHQHHRSPPADKTLPFQRGHLHKGDLSQYHNLFAEYLDVQKRLDITELPESEVKGRWKSFVGKWNRAELAEGWYDPATKTRIDDRFDESPMAPPPAARSPSPSSRAEMTRERRGSDRPSRTGADNEWDNGDDDDDNDDNDDDFGPALPRSTASRPGPTIPRLQDLQQRDELLADHRAASRADHRTEHRRDRDLQRARLDDLAPRADPGTRERQLEKKRETAAVHRGYRDAKSPGAAEIGESTLMGADGDDGGVDAYRARLKTREKIKNEREIRKEEVLRARMAEREERLAEHRRKEEGTMEMLRAMAKQRFG